MKEIELKIVSILVWLYLILSSIVYTPILLTLWLLTFWWDTNLRITHRFACFWAAQYIWLNPLWKLKITGRKNVRPRKKYVVMVNHQSLVDIIIVDSLFIHFRWVSKSKNFRIPFVGWILTINGSIKVYRNDSEAYEKFRKRTVRILEKGNSIMVFPEGTRSRSGEIGRFMDGAFKIAMETKTDILPMVLDGSSGAIPRAGWKLTGKRKLTLKVLDPLVYEDWKDKSLVELKELVKGVISAELTKLRANE